MIKILLLEDSPERILEFTERFRELGEFFVIFSTHDVNEAIKSVKSDIFDIILIDHDLYPDHYITPHLVSEEITTSFYAQTGYDFARWLEVNPDICRRNGYYFTHSLDPIGVKNICDAIKTTGKECFHFPFLWTCDKFSKIFGENVYNG